MEKKVFIQFKSFLTIIARMTEMTAVQYMQQRCIQYLAENKEQEAEKWFTTFWTGYIFSLSDLCNFQKLFNHC